MQPEPLTSSQPSDAAWDLDRELDADLDLICPGCGQDLSVSEGFATYRVCSACGRHFPLPARERLALLIDEDTFNETSSVLVSADPLRFQEEDLSASATVDEPAEAVTGGVLTGVGTIAGSPVVAIVLDLAVLGGGIGVVAGEKITLGLEQAHEQRLPALVICASGRSVLRAQDGVLALAQHAKIASATSHLKRVGVPLIAVLTDPTVGGVFTGLASHADIILAETGAHVGADAPAELGGMPATGATGQTAEDALARGLLDGVIARPDLRQTLGSLLGLFHQRGSLHARAGTEVRVAATPASGSAPVWDAVTLARHPERPTAPIFLDRIFTDVVELKGDRIEADVPDMRCALGRLGGATVAIVAQERSRSSAAGYRKTERVLRLAGHLELPVVLLIDSTGAASPGARDGDGLPDALSQTMQLLTLLPVPIVAAILGEATGESAMALCVGDRLLMLEHAVFSPVAPEFVRVPERLGSTTRSVTARECLRLGLIDAIVPEPSPAAHADVATTVRCLEDALVQAMADARSVGPRRLIDERSRRMRHLGQTTPEGRAAAKREVIHLQELQRNLSRSLTEWRERWEERSRRNQWRGRPQFHLPKPDLAGRIASIRGHTASENPSAKSE